MKSQCQQDFHLWWKSTLMQHQKLCIPFLLYACTFLITFSGLLKKSKYIMLCLFWLNKVWGKIRSIHKWRNWILWKNYSPLVKNIFWKEFFDRWFILLLLFKKTLSENFFTASFMRNDQICWSSFLNFLTCHKVWSIMIEIFSDKF